MTYSEYINEISSPSLDEFIRTAHNYLPEDKKQSPWIGLAHGVKLLDNENEMNQYLCAYGQMHKEKLFMAFENIPDPKILFYKRLNIVDWGCGQGLATICFFDYLDKLGIRPNIDKITLIEPSEKAIERAYQHIKCYNLSCQIKSICKYIDDVESSDILSSENITIHFFSNILDIETVNLEHLADTLKNSNLKDQIFVCVGPQNIGASRIEDFANLLDVKEDYLIEKYSGNLTVRGTINLLIFSKHNNITSVIKVAYQHIRKPNITNSTALQRILQDNFEAKSHEGKFIHYYKKIIEYERLKSESIEASNCQCYPLDFNDKKDLSRIDIDIQQNSTFETEFVRNFDDRRTKWPQNLNIGLCVILNGRAYRLLQYIYSQEDLKSIDISTQYISVDLYSFTLDSDMAEELGLDKEMIETLEHIISDRTITFLQFERILKDAISNNLKLDSTAYLALTAENPALTQIYKELQNLENLSPNDTLSYFLHGYIENNVKNHINKNTLIHVKDMDKSQREAIAVALNNKFSVITGPPGTGKTQLILNLIANAMVYNKSVLIASKNNKAVDNIKDRYDSIDELHYLLRFGSHETLTNQLLPYIERVVNIIPNLVINEEQNNDTKSLYRICYDSINNNQKIIDDLAKLRTQVSFFDQKLKSLNNELVNIGKQFNIENESIEKKYSDFSGFYNNEINFDRLIKEYSAYFDEIQNKSRGFRDYFFGWLYYKKYANKITATIACLPKIKQAIENQIATSETYHSSKKQQLINKCEIIIRFLTNVLSYGDEKYHIIEKYKTAKSKINEQSDKYETELIKCQKQIDIMAPHEEDAIQSIHENAEKISAISHKLFNVLVTEKFANTESRQKITKYKNYITGVEQIRSASDSTYLTSATDFLSIFKLNTVTNLSVKNAYPLQKDIFDLLVIDEASQCDVASAIPLLYRAKQVVVIGDPMQLKHISAINVSEENAIKEHLNITENPFARYANYSLWDYCKDLVSSAKTGNIIHVLDNHYRCNSQIMNYSNELFYRRRQGINLNIKTIEKNPKVTEKGIIWVDVHGEQESETRNVNSAEVDKCILIATKLAVQYPELSIGIISPFKDQIQEINQKLPSEFTNRITANTVHAFQGDEKDIIIYSLVVTNNSPKTKIHWIDYGVPNLVNVAVTRARTTLYVVGNREYIQNQSKKSLPLGYLVEYTSQTGDVRDYNTDNKTYIIDTNILVDCENILSSINPRSYIIIPAKVVDELEKLKISKDEHLRIKSEKALRAINRSLNNRLRIENSQVELLPNDYNKKQPDNLILSVAIKYQNQNPTLLSSDNGLLVKSKGFGIRSLTLKQFISNNYD